MDCNSGIRANRGKAVGAAERWGPFSTETGWGGAAAGYMWLGSEVDQILTEFLRGGLKTGNIFMCLTGNSIQIKLPSIEHRGRVEAYCTLQLSKLTRR